MDRALFDQNGSVTTEVFTDQTKTVYRTTENVSALLKSVEAQRDAFEAGPRAGARDFVPVAEIPQSVIDRAMIEGWFHDKAHWKTWLNSSEAKPFRIYGGRI